MITLEQLRQIMPNLPGVKAGQFLSHLNEAMTEFGIDTMLKTAAFVAQLAHESGEFRWMEEIWGPTAAQRRYEPQTDLSKRLGNTESGDGKRFKGRGPIQLTGRANYTRFGGVLGLDLTGAPEQVAEPAVAFRIAGLFWQNRGLNELADAGDFREVTRRINGGFNGLEDRLKYYDRAKTVLGSAFAANAPRATRGLGRSIPVVPVEPLQRGAEAIRELAPTKASKSAPANPRITRSTSTTTKAAPTKKAATKKAATKGAATKGAAKNATAKKAAVKKTAVKATAAKKATAKKSVSHRPAAKKVATKKTRVVPAASKRAPTGKPRVRKTTASG